MQTFLAIIRLTALVGGIYGGVVLLRRLSPHLNGWKRACVAIFCGLSVFSLVCTITRTNDERRQESERIEAQNRQAQVEEKEKQEMAEKAGKERIAKKKAEEQEQKKYEESKKPKVKGKDIEEAKYAVQRSIEEGIFQKVHVISADEGLVDVWLDSKFALLPFDLKQNAIGYVYVAYCKKTVNGYIRLNDGYTGKKVGVYTLRSQLELD